MTITFNDSTSTAPAVSLACKLGAEGHISWRQIGNVHLTYEDNPEESIPVYVVRKRNLHVVTDQMLSAMRDARRDMETQPGGRFSGLNLNLYPV